MTTEAQTPLRIFCSYSHRDEEYLDELKIRLAGLRRQGLIEWWHDREIVPGQEWREAIDENLKAAKIVLLLVSPDFIASDFAYEEEMRQAIARHERGEASVIPIIVRRTDLEGAPFEHLQSLPKDLEPIASWSDPDDAWFDVARGIRKAVNELSSTSREHRREAHELDDGTDRASLGRYREAVQSVWAGGELDVRDLEGLEYYANNILRLSASSTADIERKVMGDTKEAILDRQEPERVRERRKLQQQIHEQVLESAQDFYGSSIGQLKSALQQYRAELENLAEQIPDVETQAQIQELAGSYGIIVNSLERVAQDMGVDDVVVDQAVRYAESTKRTDEQSSAAVANLPGGQLLSQRTNEAGQTVQRTVDESGDIIETTLDEAGNLVDEDIVGNVADLPEEHPWWQR